MSQVDRWENVLAEVQNRQRLMDSLSASAAAEYRSQGGEIFCGRGCSGCCTLAVNCTAAEALLIARSLDKGQQENLKGYVAGLTNRLSTVADMREYLRLFRHELGGCPFLDRDICGVYSVRPISCRALLSTRVSRWCAADFSELSPAEKLAFIESLDRAAVAFPMHYLACSQDAGQKLETQTIMQTGREFGCSLYGSMPALVYLFSEWAIQESFSGGGGALLAVAASAGLDSPFVLQVDTL